MIILGIYLITIALCVILSKEIMAKLWFGMVGIYTAITYSVYVLRPELFSILNIGVLGDSMSEVGLFLTLSMWCNFLVYFLLSRSKFGYSIIDLKLRRRPKIRYFLWFHLLFLVILAAYFIGNQEKFTWGDGVNSLGNAWYALGYRIFSGATMLLIGFTLAEKTNNRLLYYLIIFMSVALIFSIALKSSARSDMIYFMLGVAVLFWLHFKISARRMFLFGLIAIPSVILVGQLMLLQRASIEGDLLILLGLVFENLGALDENTIVMLVSQDYFSPGATLIMSVEKNIVDPVAVIMSNLFNSIYFINHETISAIIVDEYGLNFARGAGFAYINYAEGYNFMGFTGFLYNGVACGLLLHILNVDFKGVSKAHENILKAILAILMMQIIRSQVGVSLKVLYTFLPIYYFYCQVFGYSLRFRRSRIS